MGPESPLFSLSIRETIAKPTQVRETTKCTSIWINPVSELVVIQTKVGLPYILVTTFTRGAATGLVVITMKY
jgi:hypothetical protein